MHGGDQGLVGIRGGARVGDRIAREMDMKKRTDAGDLGRNPAFGEQPTETLPDQLPNAVGVFDGVFREHRF